MQNSKSKSQVYVREILLCDTILKGEADSMIALPLPRTVNHGEQVYFEAIYLSLDREVVLRADVVNSKTTNLLDQFSEGVLVCQVMRYATHDSIPYAVVSLHSNQVIYYKSDTFQGEAVFAFRYWVDKVAR